MLSLSVLVFEKQCKKVVVYHFIENVKVLLSLLQQKTRKPATARAVLDRDHERDLS